MNNIIFKYQLPIIGGGKVTLDVSKGYKILSVGVTTDNTNVVWIENKSVGERRIEKITIVCVWTGERTDFSSLEYIGTVVNANSLVCHYYKKDA